MKEKKYESTELTGENGLQITLKNNSTEESFSVLADSGARISELYLSNGNELVSVIKKIENTTSKNRDDIFCNAKLSPFAGRIKDGKFSFNSIDHQLIKNYPEENNACHGFVFDKKFSVIDKTITTESASCTLEYKYSGDMPGYPFAYIIQLTYQLSQAGLACTTTIKNNSSSQIPLSDGWHFYFDLGIEIDNLKLKTENCELMELDSQMIPTGKSKMFTEFTEGKNIRDTTFDSCFKLHTKVNAETHLISYEKKLDLTIWQDAGEGKYQYLVIYTPPDRKTIAIEPMTSNISSFNNGEGLIILNPKESFNANFGISLIKNI